MATPIVRKLPSFEGVAAGHTASVVIPCTLDYEFMRLRASSTIGGNPATSYGQTVTNVKLTLRGRTLFDLTPAEIIERNARYGDRYNATDANELQINFREDWLWSEEESAFTGLFTADLDQLVLEVTIASGVTLPNLSGIASGKVQRPNLGPVNVIRKTEVLTLPCPTAGTHTFRNLFNRGILKAAVLHDAAVTGAVVIMNDYEVKNYGNRAELAAHMRTNEQNLSDGFFVIPFDEDAKLDAGVDVAAEVREGALKVTVNAAATVRCIVEFYEAVTAA